MGKKDEYQFDYLDDAKRFADQINGALFGGKQVVRPEELEAEDSRMISMAPGPGAGRAVAKIMVDKARIWRGRKFHIFMVENQNYVDYQMVLRNMLSESIGYRKQWKQKKRVHTEQKDLRGKDEYLSGMKPEEKFMPIITLVVYFGTEHTWDGAKCLYDLLDIEEELKEYVTNYRLNLYDCQEHDTFSEYRTGLRQVFETVRYAGDKEKLKKIIEENSEIYSRIDCDTKDMLEVVANVKIPEKFKTIEEEGKETYDMCKAFEDMRLEGYNAGVADGYATGVTEGVEKGYATGITEGIAEGIEKLIETVRDLGASKTAACGQLIQKYALSEKEAQGKIEKYWVD